MDIHTRQIMQCRISVVHNQLRFHLHKIGSVERNFGGAVAPRDNMTILSGCAISTGDLLHTLRVCGPPAEMVRRHWAGALREWCARPTQDLVEV